MLRINAQNSFDSIIITHGGVSGKWLNVLITDSLDTVVKASFSGPISVTGVGNTQIRLIMLGTKGWLFLKGVYFDKLDLSGLTTAGEVSAITSYFIGDGIAGHSTRFEDFTIWSADGQ